MISRKVIHICEVSTFLNDIYESFERAWPGCHYFYIYSPLVQHSDNFDYELMVEDIYNYIQQHNLTKVNLLGHSMGGKVAMFFAVNFPEFVNHLMVADISPKYYKPHHGVILEALNTVNFAIHTTRRDVEEVLKTYITEPGMRQFLLKNVYW